VTSSAVDDLFGDRDRRHRPRPTRVERQVDDDFLELGLGQAVFPRSGEMTRQLFGTATGDQCGHGDQAAIAG
jgi:hypothetical protein